VSILLALALVTSIVFIATPVSAAGFVDTNYSSKVIQITPGGIFVLRTELVWDEVDVPGYYIVQIVWEDNNRADENFTVLYTRAFIDNDNDNLPGASPIWLENSTVLTSGPGTSGTRYAFKVQNNTGDSNDGKFDVEIYVQAASRGTPHRAPWDNHPINKSGWGGIIRYAESEILSTTPAVTTIKVLVAGARGVDVSVSPGYQSGLPGAVINYTVTVMNTGGLGPDNYNLSKGDNAGWGDNVWLDNYRLENIPQGENRTTTLHVRIPGNATGSTEDNVWVRATSQGDNTKSDNESCITHVTIVRGVQVVIDPSPPAYLENENGRSVTFTVTVKNMGNVQENFQLTRGDNSGWTLALDNTWLLVPKGENRTTRLTVTIPANARGCTWDNIWVKATSKDNTGVFDNKSCLAHVKVVRGVDVSISPSYQSGAPGATLSYTVTVKNKGNVSDTYSLTTADNAGWSRTISPSSLSLAAGASGTATLTVTIPSGAENCTRDNVRVIATGTGVSAENNCIAHAITEIIRKGVNVSISPTYRSGAPGTTLTYTVTVKNIGNVEDNFSLEGIDNLGWHLELDDDWLIIQPGENMMTNLRVTIPIDAAYCTEDNVTIIVKLLHEPAVENRASCVAHALEVGILIPAMIDIDPDTLNLRSKGELVTCYIELPSGYSVENIDVSTIRLIVETGNVPAENWPTAIGDYDKDGVPDLMVKFDRATVHALFSSPGIYTMTVTGQVAGIAFEGSDNVRVINPTRRRELFNRLAEIGKEWPYAPAWKRDGLFNGIVDIGMLWPFTPE